VSALQLRITSWGQIELDKLEMRAVMRAAGNEIKQKTQRLISNTAGSGRSYRGDYRASAPGNPPILWSGALRSSLRTYAFRSGEGFAVREREFYALFLEAGAQGGGGFRGGSSRQRYLARKRARRRGGAPTSRRILLKRPALNRVMDEEAPNLNRRIDAALKNGLKWRQTK
jgi:hypothetical protein